MIRATDTQVLDQILKEKGITREQVGKQRLDEAQAARERIEWEKEAAFEKNERERVRLIKERLLNAYNARMLFFIDGEMQRPGIKDFDEIRCPACQKTIPEFRQMIVMAEQEEARIYYTSTESTVILITNPYPTVEGKYGCKCGARYEIKLTMGAPIRQLIAQKASAETAEDEEAGA
ncbi:MAG: hypothetical protein NT137_00175 [Methanomassiliicoccales archaeon]|nr:hypothetical protein [Methanomassiliicoccales archaeon]